MEQPRSLHRRGYVVARKPLCHLPNGSCNGLLDGNVASEHGCRSVGKEAVTMTSTTDRTEIPVDCPIDRMLRLLWREWTTHILWVLGHKGAAGFGDLRRSLAGISSK